MSALIGDEAVFFLLEPRKETIYLHYGQLFTSLRRLDISESWTTYYNASGLGIYMLEGWNVLYIWDYGIEQDF